MFIYKDKVIDYHKDYGPLSMLLTDLINKLETVQKELVDLMKRYDNETFKTNGHFYLKFKFCNKNGCRSCPHGPYWHQFYSTKGEIKGRYIGAKVTKSIAQRYNCQTNLNVIKRYNKELQELQKRKNKISNKLDRIRKILLSDV